MSRLLRLGAMSTSQFLRALRRPAWGLLGLLLAVLALMGCEERAQVARPRVAFSLFAVGDTGIPSGDEQLRVARGIGWRDSQRPADGLVLLGDNFYPHGLERGELVERVVRNVISPYCRFVKTSPARLPPGKWACGRGGPPGRTVWAVLGNHDHEGVESAELQRNEVKELVANWKMPRGQVEVFPLESGVDLILVDSVELVASGRFDELRAALQASRGPWRILVAHYPFLPEWRDPIIGAAMRGILRAMGESGVGVQLALGGHEHNLQVVAPPAPGPALQVIAGGGSSARPLRGRHAGRLYVAQGMGFARVDLVADRESHLQVQIFEVPEEAWPWLSPAPRTACFRIRITGEVDRRCRRLANS